MTKKIIYSLAILFTILFSVSSCKKSVDKKAEDDLAASVAGTYIINYFYLNREFSLDEISGKVDITKKDQNTISAKLTLIPSGGAPKETELGDEQLKVENSVVSIYSGTDKVGTTNGSDLEIHVIEGNDELVVRAKK